MRKGVFGNNLPHILKLAFLVIAYHNFRQNSIRPVKYVTKMPPTKGGIFSNIVEYRNIELHKAGTATITVTSENGLCKRIGVAKLQKAAF